MRWPSHSAATTSLKRVQLETTRWPSIEWTPNCILLRLRSQSVHRPTRACPVLGISGGATRTTALGQQPL
eukprot:9845169-Alexandrium_andersonii.AAC.1